MPLWLKIPGGGRREPRRRGIWIRLDGARVRFELDRKHGLSVKRGRRRPEKLVSFRDLADVADGQIKMNLI